MGDREPLRALIYARVSQDKSGVGRSPEEQERDLLDRISREEWLHVGTITETDRSASRHAKRARERWPEVLERVSSGDIDVLMLWEVSRLTRNMEEFVDFARACRKASTRLSYNGRLYDLTDPDDEFQVILDIGLGQRESGVTRKRVLRAIEANAQNGRPHGRILFGYQRIYDQGTGALREQVIDEEQAAVVREIFTRFAGGTSIYAISQDLTKRGLTTRRGRPWLPSQVRRVLVNPAYIGRRVHVDRVREATWPAIIDESLFYRAQARLADPDRAKVLTTAARHLLSGIAVCGVCDTGLRVQQNRGYLAYLCPNGFHVSIRMEKLDEFVRDLVCERLSRPDALAVWREERDNCSEVLTEIAATRQQLQSLIDQAISGRISAESMGQIEPTLRARLDDLERRAASAAKPIPPVLVELSGRDVRARWDDPDGLSLTQKREIVRALMAPRVNRTYRGARTVEPGRLEPGWLSLA